MSSWVEWNSFNSSHDGNNRMKKKRIMYVVVAVVAAIVLLGVGSLFGGMYSGGGYTQTSGQSYGLAESVSMDFGMGRNKMAMLATDEDSGAPDVAQEDRKIVRTARMSVVAENVEQTAGIIEDYAVANGGFVVSSSFNKSGVAPSATVSIRVPSEGLDAAMEHVGGLGEVKSTNVDGRDVTAEFVDVEAQLKNYRAAEVLLLEIMNRAVRVEDVLHAHRELSNTRNQIERLQGRLKYLQETTDLSLLTIHLSADPESLPVIDETETWKPFATVKHAVRGLAVFGKWLGDMVIWLLVFSPVVVVLLVAYWLFRRKLRH